MTAIRNELANATEQTVLALKELETRIGVLKNDLAWLCQGIGHPEAARVAASPVPSLLAPAGFASAAFAPGFQAGFPLGQGFQSIQGSPLQGGQLAPVGIPTQAIGALAPPFAATPFGSAASAFVHPAYANPSAPYAAYPQTYPQAFPQAFATPFGSPFAAIGNPAYAMARAQPSLAYDVALAYR